MFYVVYRKTMFRRPLRVFAIAGLFVLVSATLVWVNATMTSRGAQTGSVENYLAFTFERNVLEGAGHGEFVLNRTTALAFWWQKNADLAHPEFWIGHGVGESRTPSSGPLEGATLASDVYAGMGIGLTALSGMLWEIGLLGVLILLGVFALGLLSTAQALRRVPTDDPWCYATLQAIHAGLLMFMLSLLYKNFMLHHLAFQALFVSMLGYVAYCHKHLLRDA